MPLSKDYVLFFKELSANNSTEWFQANKKRFEEHVKQPFTELVADIIDRMKLIDHKINIDPRDCLFRINRDIRFSNDKSPYKNYMAAIVSRTGRKEMDVPGIYFHVEADSLLIAGGSYQPPKAQLDKIRRAIAQDPHRVNKILNGKKFTELYGGLGGGQYKVLPAEFRDAAKETPALFQKSFHYEKTYRGMFYITRKDLASFITSHYSAAGEWNKFLEEALG